MSFQEAFFYCVRINTVMIHYCPYCGHDLKKPVLYGISSCNNCYRVFDSNLFHKILSAAWMARKRHLSSADQFVQQWGDDPYITAIINEFVIDGCCNHEEFLQVLKELGIEKEQVLPMAS